MVSASSLRVDGFILVAALCILSVESFSIADEDGKSAASVAANGIMRKEERRKAVVAHAFEKRKSKAAAGSGNSTAASTEAHNSTAAPTVAHTVAHNSTAAPTVAPTVAPTAAPNSTAAPNATAAPNSTGSTDDDEDYAHQHGSAGTMDSSGQLIRNAHSNPVPPDFPVVAATNQTASSPTAAPVADADAARLALAKNGYCTNWFEGSSVRDLGSGNSYFSQVSGEAACWSKCFTDGACEQAVYQSNTQECWLGINAMSQDPVAFNTTCEACDQKCYAKNGWNHTLAYAVKDGWCENWEEGWSTTSTSPPRMTQCDFTAAGNAQLECSHWGAEYGLSERGCWQKCQENAACTQAVYEDKTNSWSCYIGTGTMTAVPTTSRCHDCNNKCYSKSGSFAHSGGSITASSANATASR